MKSLSHVEKPSSAYGWPGDFPRFSGFRPSLLNDRLDISEIVKPKSSKKKKKKKKKIIVCSKVLAVVGSSWIVK